MNKTRNVLHAPAALNAPHAVHAVLAPAPAADAEEIVADERLSFTPSDLVQQKLQRLLPAAMIPVSCLHAGRQVRRYQG